MSRPSKILLGFIAGLFILACNLVSGPISEVENAASTAESFATSIPLETIESIATTIPMQTLEALPSEIPDYGNYFSPEGTPVEQWNDIPIMPEATVGQEIDENTYSYTVPLAASDVQAFYDQNLEALGWTSTLGFQPSEDGGILLYQKDSEFLSITMVAEA